MEFKGVLVDRGKQAVLKVHVRHVEVHLSPIDAIPSFESAFDKFAPGLRVGRLVLPQDWPGQPEIGAGYDHSIDMSANAPARDREAKLIAISPFVAQVEAGGAQPANGQRLELMSVVEDAERLAVEVFPGIGRCISEFVDELACAGFADAAAAEIVARRLLTVLLDQRAVDQRVDALAGRPAHRLAAIYET